MNTALQQQRLEVEQLRREAAMKRIPVSQAVEDIKVKKIPFLDHFLLNMFELVQSGIWLMSVVVCIWKSRDRREM